MLTDRSRKALTLCSTLAIASALVAGSGAARAQSFQGSSTVVAGSATVSTGTGTTTVDISSPSAVIDWTPFDNAINNGAAIGFQPAGTTATFQSFADFAVLNRILPTDATRPIQFDGTVISRLQGSASVPGGTVFFYSPGGIIVGSTAVFDVGNLGLTSSAPVVDAGGNFIDANGRVSFAQANAGSFVHVRAGSSITASQPGSYVAVVAPRVLFDGRINVNGSAALVAADAVDITFRDSGLFDIQVTAGTSSTGNAGNGQVLGSTGTITGPAGSGLATSHRAYLVAVPKNTAITMAIGQGSSLGFDIAGAADVDGNAVILSGGYDIFGGEVSSAPSVGAGSGAAQLDVFNAAFTSDVRGRFSGIAQIAAKGAFGSGTTSFAQNLTLHSDTEVGLYSDQANGNLTIAGNATLDADRFSSGQGQAATGGNLTIGVSNGGAASIGGSATLNARGFGGSSFTSGLNGGAGTGGMAQIGTFQGGSLTIGGALAIDAGGFGGQVSVAGTTGGAGAGGIAQIYHDQAGTITLNGGVTLRANGSGGNVSGAGTGGSGTGGTARAIFYNTVGGTSSGGMTVTGNLLAESYGFGGQGGIGQGGTSRLAADTTGQTISVTGDVVLKASGFGGDGANGFGGFGEIVATGTSDITVNSVNVVASGTGGDDAGAGAGAGTGGFAQLRVSGAGASLTVNNVSADPDFFDRRILSSDGFGGSTGFAGATAGTGTGGNSTIDVNSGGTLNLPVVATTTSFDFMPVIWSRGFGGLGLADGTTAGNAVGGTANILVNGGTMTSGPTQLSAVAIGGTYDIEASGNINGGNGSGGTRNVSVTNGGTLSIGLPGGVAGGAGGEGLGTGRGGDASGGFASLLVDNATLNITSDSIVVNQNGAGFGAVGGNATGGSTFAQVVNGGVINIDPAATLRISSNAFAGGSFNPGGVSGGNAIGGSVNLLVDGGTISGGALEVLAVAEGGGGQVGVGGNGKGGNAVVQLRNATISGDSLTLDATGAGGFIDFGVAGTGGTGTGGFAQIESLGGTNALNLTGFIAIDAGGQGGFNNGTGTAGNGIGGTSRLVVSGGTLTITSPETELEDDGAGGDGGSDGAFADGGDGTAGIADVFANGGTLVVNGNLNLEADGEGGFGISGGDGISDPNVNPARAIIRAQNGSITVTGTTNLSAQGEGGNAVSGGAGGNATGGSAIIDAQSTLAGGSSISLQDVNVYADAFGGFGGFGVSDGAGGAGGSGAGGTAQLLGDAGNGVLTVAGATFASASGYGGGGGSGGSGAVGGAGGAGGAGIGGGVIIGTRSGLDTPSNTGSASFADITASAVGSGGFGGDGGTGSASSAAGGDGGDAQGGAAVIQTRGVPTSITGTALLSADAIGGDGGAGSTAGIGGDATVGGAGGLAVLVTNRFNRTEQGSLVGGGSIFGSAQALPGRTNDVPVGASTVGDIPAEFQVLNGSVNFGAIAFFVDAASVAPGALPSDITLTNATVNLSQNLHLVTPGDLVLALDNATLNVADLLLDARNFILPATAPATPGTINVSGPISITSGQDILTYANFTGQGATSLFANGAIRVGNFTTTGDLFFQALGGSVTTGNLQAVGDIDIDSAQAIATGAIVSGESIVLDAVGAITTAALTAGDTVEVSAGGALSVGDASAGIVNPSTSSAAEYNVALRSMTSIAAGKLSAANAIGLASPGTIATGTLSANGLGVLALAGTGFSSGAITTPSSGRVYVANFSMESLGGQIAGSFDPTPILAAAPVAVGGPVTINGAVSTGTVQINAAQNLAIAGTTTAGNLVSLVSSGNLTTGAIQAVNAINAVATGALTAGNLTAGAGLTIQANGPIQAGALQSGASLLAGSNGTLTTGNVQAVGDATLNAMGAIQTGSILAGQGVFMGGNSTITTLGIDAGNRVAIQAMGSLNLGNITAGIVNPSTATGAVYRIGLSSGGSITSGNLTARNGVLVGATTTLSTGAIAGSQLLLLAGTGISTGALTAGTLNLSTGTRALDGQILIADISMGPLGGPFNNYDPTPVFAATPVALNGPIAISGPVAANLIRANATGPITVGGAITAGLGAVLVSGGALSTAAIQSGDQINLVGGAGVTTGNLTGGTNPSAKIAIAGGTGSVGTGAISTRGDVGIQAAQNITTGTILGRDVLLLPGGGLTTGSISALNGTQPTGRVYIGNFSMATTAANAFSSFPTLSLFNAPPVATGGPITLGGAVNAASLVAATSGAFSAQAITAGSLTQPGFIDVTAGGLATVGGAWRSASIDLVSGDINIASTGSLDALSAAGEIFLGSTSGSGTFVGDGTTGSGYALSNDEFSRIKAGNIVIAASDNAGVATDLTIGTLTINAAQLYGANGTIVFASGNLVTETPSGILRIAGAVTANGFAATNEIALLSGTVEIEAANGSLKVNNGSGGLGGLVTIEADHVHVASDAILTKLRADPFYAGHVIDLNTPATVQRPDGVLNALGLEVFPGQTFYIQNTGTATMPAGFVTTQDGSEVTPPDSPPANGVEVVINGQFVDANGNPVTGKAVYDAIAADPEPDDQQFAGFSETSQINGCAFASGTCTIVQQSDPVAALSSEIALVTNAVIDDSPTAPAADDADEGDDGSSDDQDDNDDSDEGAAPIAPPTPLISTRPLNGDVDVVEPVAGAGNPALFGSAVNEETAGTPAPQGDKP